MRAILIDAAKRQFREIMLDPADTLSGMQAAVGGRIEVSYTFPDGKHTLYVNEEGLYLPGDAWLMVQESPELWMQPTKGNAIVCGFDDATGDTVACSLSLREVGKLVKFCDSRTVALYAQLCEH